tara:strand:- start:2488 stop:3777 length:1290 start_codon:yes stop_codon:yes gene_type:complete
VKVNVNKVNKYSRELSIDVPWSELESDFNIAIKKFSKKVKVPGFRAGKMPKDMLMKQYLPNIEAEFMENNFQKYYLMAIQNENLIPINQAEIRDVHFHQNEHFSFKAIFEIEPELVLPKLKKNSLKIQRTRYLHDEQDIEDALLQLRKAHATINSIEDGAKEGDYLICSLQKLDETGLPIIGKKFDQQYLRVGNGSFTDDQKDKLIGLNPGETARVNLPIGENNEKADYELTVSKVERENLPEINEEFIKLVNPDLTSVEELRADVKQKIESNFEERSKQAYERDLSDALINFVDPAFSPSMVENYLNNLVEDVKKQNNGEPLDEDKVREHYKVLAERNVKWYSIRKNLIETQNISTTKEELEQELENLIQRSPNSEKEIRKFYKKPSNRQRIEDDITEKKILEYLEQFAKVKDVEVNTKELRKEQHAH